MSDRQFQVVIREVGSSSPTRIDCTGVIVLTEVQKGVFMMSLRGVDMPRIVLACATLMKYSIELHSGFPEALEVALEKFDSLPSIGQIIDHGKVVE